jgi:hypothetical protein
MELIFLNDFLRDVAEFDLCKFGSFEWCHEVEIGKVDAHEARPRVEMTLFRNILIRRSVAMLVPTSSG